MSRKKILRFPATQTDAPKVSITLHFDTLSETQLVDIKCRLQKTLNYSINLFNRAKVSAISSNTFYAVIRLYDSYEAFREEHPGHARHGYSSIAQEASRNLGTAWLYQTPQKMIPNLEHEFAHFIQYYWFGKQAMNKKVGLDYFFEGFAEVLAHESICHHTVRYAKNLPALKTIPLKNTLTIKKSRNASYRKIYLIVAYLVENNVKVLAFLIQAFQKQNFAVVREQLNNIAKTQQQNFERWIESLRTLPTHRKYKSSELYCPVDSLQTINFEALNSKKVFLERYYYSNALHTPSKDKSNSIAKTREYAVPPCNQSTSSPFLKLLVADDVAALTNVFDHVLVKLLFDEKVNDATRNDASSLSLLEFVVRHRLKKLSDYFLTGLNRDTISEHYVFQACLIALQYSNFEFLEDLLLFGNFKMSFQDSKGATLLHHAVQKDPKSVEWVCKHTTQLGLETDYKGNTPLHYAVTTKTIDWKIVSMLIEHGADLDKKNHKKHTPRNMLLRSKGYENVVSSPVALSSEVAIKRINTIRNV